MCIYRVEDGICRKFTTDEVTSYCVDGPCEYEKLSNYERIKAMSVEEMADFLEFIYISENGRKIIIDGTIMRTADIKNWLESEVEE